MALVPLTPNYRNERFLSSIHSAVSLRPHLSSAGFSCPSNPANIFLPPKHIPYHVLCLLPLKEHPQLLPRGTASLLNLSSYPYFVNLLLIHPIIQLNRSISLVLSLMPLAYWTASVKNDMKTTPASIQTGMVSLCFALFTSLISSPRQEGEGYLSLHPAGQAQHFSVTAKGAAVECPMFEHLVLQRETFSGQRSPQPCLLSAFQGQDSQ